MVTSDDLPTAVDFNNILVNYIEISTDDIPSSRRESSQPQPKSASYQQPAPTVTSHEPTDEDQADTGTVTPGEEEDRYEEPLFEEMPEGDFRQLIPQALLDIDLPEDEPRYKQAAQVIQDAPAPPSLPLFLSRSILNGNTPVKDDSSVLTLPNHTVLNHLMTSSVRNGVLATSVTTRYKKKVGEHCSGVFVEASLTLAVCNDHLLQACPETQPNLVVGFLPSFQRGVGRSKSFRVSEISHQTDRTSNQLKQKAKDIFQASLHAT